MNRLLLVATLHIPLILSCSGTRSQSDGGPLDAIGDADANPDFSSANGTLVVSTFLSQNSIGLRGTFNDGPQPEFMIETQREGFCRLMTYTPTLCKPACQGAELCLNGSCQTSPMPQDRGSLQWTWPGGQATIEPDQGNFYNGTGTLSMHGEVTVSVQNETLRVQTNPPPEASEDWGQAIANRSGNVILQWTNPISDARVRLRMTDCAGSHGGIAEAEIRCEAPDTGELVLPASFLEVLDAADWSRGECGSHSVIRYHSDTVSGSDFQLEARANGSFFYRPK